MSNINDSYEPNLDLNLLRVFAMVAEEGSVTRAAARLHVTQPAVSAAIRRLATYVGAELFTRQGRGLVPTSRGAELVRAARLHLPQLIAATMAAPLFDPKLSTAMVRVGLADPLETLLLPRLLRRLGKQAPRLQLIVLPVQFRTVERALLDGTVDLAVTVADALVRSIVRRPLIENDPGGGKLVCLYDARHTKLVRGLSEREYFAREHVVVSYAGDVRGVVEDALGKTRRVRVSVPAFSYVADVVDDSPLIATVPLIFAHHLSRRYPRLRWVPLPFSLPQVTLELLWSRANDEDPAGRFVRGLLLEVGTSLGLPPVGERLRRAAPRS